MPLFFIVTGYLWKTKRIQYYFRRYIVTYFILCGINLLLYSCMLLVTNKDIPIKRYIIGILYSRGTTEWMPNCSPLWFLTGLFCAVVIFECIQKFHKQSVKAVLVIASGIISTLLSYFNIFKLPWNIDTALMAVVFLYAGHILKQTNLLEKLKDLTLFSQILIFPIMGVLGMLAIIYNPTDSVSFDGNHYGNCLLMIVGALLICLILFYLCYIVPWGGICAKVLSWYGKHTVFIMGFDYFAGSIARGVLSKLGLEKWPSLFLIKVILLAVLCLIWNFLVGRIKSIGVRKMLLF